MDVLQGKKLEEDEHVVEHAITPKRKPKNPRSVANKRRGPYSYYGKEKAKKLFEYYFVDKRTVEEACHMLGIKKRTGYHYIRKLKVMNLPNIYSDSVGYSRDKQMEGLVD